MEKGCILEGIVQISKTRVECIYCGVCIPKAAKCIKQHTNGAKHQDVMSVMAKNGVRFFDGKLYCKLCDVDVEEGETLQEHIERADHATWLAAVLALVDGEYLHLTKYFVDDSEEILCEACNCPFKFSPRAIEQHVNWFNHRSNVAERVKPMNGLFNFDNDLQVWCKICNIVLLDNSHAILTHVDRNPVHRDWLAHMDSYVHDEGFIINGFLSIKHKLTIDCGLCNKEVKCNIFSIEEHIHSIWHQCHPRPKT